MRVWDAASGQPLTPPLKDQLRFQLVDRTKPPDFSPDGRYLLTLVGLSREPPKGPGGAWGFLKGGEAQIWEAATGKAVTVPLSMEDGVQEVSFSPDGSRYAASLWQHNRGEQQRAAVLVHETLTSRILLAFLPPTGVAHLRFSQDGARLAGAYDDGTLELRTVPAGQSARPLLPSRPTHR